MIESDRSFADALEEYRPYLLRYAHLHLLDNTLAEDAVQETLLAALENLGTFSGKSSIKTWLTGILKHKIIDHYRKQAKEGTRVGLNAKAGQDENDFDTLFNADGAWRALPHNWGDPEKSLENKHFWEVFEICRRQMPVAAARAFMMREIMGLGTDEICKELQISSTHCYVMLYRARMSLRLCLERKWFGDLFEGK
jgi:RNA polymerase sigma-70 factor, ECF subfamily